MKVSLTAVSALAAMCVLLGTLPALAQVEMDQEMAVREAIRNSPNLAVLQSLILQGEASVKEAATDINDPELRFEDISTKYTDRNENFEFHLGLRFKPPRIGEVAENRQEETVRLWERRVEFQRERAAVTAEARKALAGVALAVKELELAQERVELERTRLKTVTSLVDIGERNFNDRIKAMARLLKAKNDVIKARISVGKQRNELAAITGVRDRVVPVDSLGPTDVPDRQTMLEVALRNRHDLELARQRLSLAEKSIRVEKIGLIPWLSFVELGYNHESANEDWGELRFGIELPFSKWTMSGLRRAESTKQVSVRLETATRQTLEIEIDQALDALRSALEISRDIENDLADIEQADGLLSLAKKDSTVAPDDLIDLELTRLDSGLALAQASYGIAVAIAELCAAGGVDNFSDLNR